MNKQQVAQIDNNYQDGRLKLNHINHYIKRIQSKVKNKKVELVRMNKKKMQDSGKCFSKKYILILKYKDGKLCQLHHGNTKYKAGYIKISYVIDFKRRNITRDKDQHFIRMKGQIIMEK